MEVHNHTHTPRKKWTHYLWEFLMLFLAVFCGFLAENIREHKVEHERAKQFALSLYSDLKSDTSALNMAIESGNKKILSTDSLIAQLEQPFEKWKDTLVYRYTGSIGRIRPFKYNSGTYEQMKASGSLRYFKQELADLLNRYAVQAEKTKIREDIHLNYATNLLNPFTIKILDSRPLIQLQDGRIPTHPLVFTKRDKETIALWINYSAVTQSTQQRMITEYTEMLKLAKEIIIGLQNEYHLK